MSEHQQDLFNTEPAPWEVDDQSDCLVARVVFPEAPPGEFSYRVPDALRGTMQAGCRVRVPLGRGNRTAIGYCIQLQKQSSSSYPLKDVRDVVDEVPLISPPILELTRWMSTYYLCDLGPILEAVVPAGVRAQAGTREIVQLHVPTNVAARLTQLKLPPKQAAVLQYLVGCADAPTPADVANAVGCTTAPIQALRKKGLIQAEQRRVQVLGQQEAVVEPTQPWPLNHDQQRALDSITTVLHSGDYSTLLLRGVTGSGKTEVYIRAIEEVTSFGRQAIVLVPEISLTPQTQRRFQSRLPHVAVLHSHLTPSERHWQWQRIAKGEVQVVVGARSAVFAPTPHLGLIVIDEEHEPSFKQDTAPRYHARDVALHRAQAEGVPLLLGSATPSLESWYRARQGDYQLVEMPSRVEDRPMPRVVSVDLRVTNQERTRRGAISRRLYKAMELALQEGGQVILLLNRRGFSTQIQCPACGEVVRCPECDISLTYHRDGERVICHYCNYQSQTPPKCPSCQFTEIRFSGQGTQRLEAEVRARFKNANVLRMDSDTMRGPGAHEAALERFRSGEVQILLGTQMIAKGLDFPNVTLVGVVNADLALHLPDFRAAERTFQLVTQVAGRTGRGDKGGHVLVQTYSPEHFAIENATEHDFARFAELELQNRREFGYPPFSSMFRAVFRADSESKVETFSEAYAERLSKLVADHGESTGVLGPVPAPISRLRGKSRYHLLIHTTHPDAVRDAFRQVDSEFRRTDDVQWMVDVDAISML
ncbi:MAG: primosomal protein N' [Planctomycetales bacterium]|nr:primosomal protein N' [Planctomycetales bacterium]